jgi:hypothetical protein
VTFFPIRHHSPACAAHLRRWILSSRPASILVEGPASFTAMIDHLVDERCVCPVALYTTFVDKKGRLHSNSGTAEEEKKPVGGPLRFAAYYPFCDYSPELVALRSGKVFGARLRFIDLEYAEMILTRQANGSEEEGIRLESLAADPHLWHSEYVRTLALRLGCRDFNEVWDHLFESGADSLDTDPFIDRVATYCALARLAYTPEALDRDGTSTREACMAAAIVKELHCNEAEKRTGPVLVVTGGFHTAALPDLVAAGTNRPPPLALGEEEAGTWLMRYSFDQLDVLAGYASGMPSPAFYDRMWHAADPQDAASAAARTRAVADLVVEIGRQTRQQQFSTAITTPDAIAAVQLTRQLAELRGHPWPLREDVLDGLRSCFVKGEMGVEGQLLMHLVRDVLAGNRVGQLPPGTGSPPILDDFYREAARFRLPVEAVEKRELTLDLYRNANHRQLSRLCHRLTLLGTPFATFLGGPDFAHCQDLDLLRERWEVCWSPGTESALIEASVFGPTIAEAAASRLRERIARLQEEGQGRSTAAAVELLVHACRLGLHAQAASLVPLIDVHIAEDPDLPSVVRGLSQLELLAHAREPLEAAHLTALPRLTQSAYHRAVRLLDNIAACPDEMVEPVMGALRTLREVLAGSAEKDELDRDLFRQGLERVIGHAPDQAQAAVVGAAAGILYGQGDLSEEALLLVTRGYLGGAVRDPRRSCGILRGLLATAREAAWQVRELLRTLDAEFRSWDDTTFLQALPELRLAFTDLTPREISHVADQVAGLHGEASLGELVQVGVDEDEVRLGLEATNLVRESLRTDGLHA